MAAEHVAVVVAHVAAAVEHIAAAAAVEHIAAAAAAAAAADESASRCAWGWQCEGCHHGHAAGPTTHVEYPRGQVSAELS